MLIAHDFMNIQMFMLFELHILNILLSQYMLTCFETTCGRTLESGKKMSSSENVTYQTYNVEKMGRSGINSRLTPCGIIEMFLNPMTRDMDFRHIKILLQDTINKLKKNEDSTQILSKIEFAKALIQMLDRFTREEKLIDKANDHLVAYMTEVNPVSSKTFVIKQICRQLYSDAIDEDEMENFLANTKTECFSGIHTIKDAISFWQNPKSVKKIDTNIHTIRFFIVRFLSFSKNSSSTERSFSGIKRNCDPKRPRLGAQNMFRQHFLRELRQQNQLIHQYSLMDESERNTIVEAITFEKQFKKMKAIDSEDDLFDNEEYAGSEVDQEELEYQKFVE